MPDAAGDTMRPRWRRWATGVVVAFALAAAAQAADEPPRWFDGGRPSAAARQAVALLNAADTHGLDPADYSAAALRQAIERSLPDAEAAAQLGRALTEAMRRYLGDLHAGRIDPRTIHPDFVPPRRAAFDADAALRAALRSGDLAQAERAAAPPLPLYAQLREQLALFRRLADAPAWREPLPPLPAADKGARKLEPGQGWAGLGLLRERLIVLGDLPAAAPPSSRYDGALVDAVKAFQQRHGLTPDGVVGPATFAQLRPGPAQRARQIELMLERLRWTPPPQGPRLVVVNIPEFVLRAYEVQGDRVVVRHEMRVIVGKAFDARTPLLDEDMRYVEFAPYWNVPTSIARAETVPKLERDPGYLEREGFEFVAPDGSASTTFGAEQLAAVRAGRLRLRQRPGPRNALGGIKFGLPNRQAIYLHHTPSVRLFERDRRDFSHGCIRVEQPVALATFVLHDNPDWTEARIRDAMAGGQSRTVRLATAVPVLIAYGTALVRAGRPVFFDDIYGLDRVLDQALRERPARPPIIAP